ncbi:MAG TPA: cystathionine beta-synthase [Anaerolineae bacterium]|nr:cystathionine beta-synthase [Anaerolineae bacterium]
MSSKSSEIQYYSTVLDAVGHTPLVRLNRVVSSLHGMVLAKLEYLNPGGSVKDRIGLAMIEDAEASGRLKPGGTIVEATSGNTGVGLAIAAAIKGYRCVFVMPDKMSEEKVRLLRAFGARVVITPTAVEPDDPRSYYSVSQRIVAETPNSILANQYHNPMNPEAHYRTTGPEIWQQTAGQVKVFVTGMGTGGTLTGAARYLKQQNPGVKVVGVDPVGSLLYDTWRLGRVPDEPFLKTYKIEGIGEDFLPGALDLSVCDEVVQADDKESFLMTRRLVREEGLFCGGSSGSAVAGLFKSKHVRELERDEIAVVILPDSGSRYLSKVFDDAWMRENGFLEAPWGTATAMDVLAAKPMREVIAVAPTDKVRDAIARMQEHDISQMPVISEGRLFGMVTETNLLNHLVSGGNAADDAIAPIVQRQVTTVGSGASLESVMGRFAEASAVIVLDQDRVAGIITKIDLIDYLAAHSK